MQHMSNLVNLASLLDSSFHLVSQVSKSPVADLRASSVFWNPHHLRSLHVGDDFLGHSNEAVPTPILLPNLVSNHLTIVLLLDDNGGALALVLLVGLGVDERTLDGEALLVLLIRNHLLGLRTLVGLVAFLMALEACHGSSILKLLHHVVSVILRRLYNALALQSCQVPHEPFYFLLELIILLGNEIIT
jgi:hypothetical protein